MAKKQTITVNGSTVIDVTGLTPAQVAQVKKISSAGGNYGSKGAALAASLRKQAATTKASGGTASGTPATAGIPIDKTTGAIGTGAVDAFTGMSKDDTQATFNLSNPGSQTTATGDSRTVERDPVTGAVKIVDKAGAGLNAASSAFTNAATGLASGGRQAAQDASYNYISKDYAQNKQREIEATKQELAQRGIPIDPNPESLWSKSLQNIDQKYQSLDDQAKNQALTAGNQYYATDVSGVQALGQTVAGQAPNFTAFQGGAQNTANTALGATTAVSGSIANANQLAIQKKLEEQNIAVRRLAASKSGGGGGSSGGGDIITSGAP